MKKFSAYMSPATTAWMRRSISGMSSSLLARDAIEYSAFCSCAAFSMRPVAFCAVISSISTRMRAASRVRMPARYEWGRRIIKKKYIVPHGNL